MDFHGWWRSMSGRTMVFVFLAAAYYVALNAVLINEIVEQVQMGPQRPVAMRSQSPVTAPDPQDPSAACAGLAKADRDICKAELLVGKASTRFSSEGREERRQRRAAREDWRQRTAAREDRRSASPALTGTVHRESAAPVVR
jgi:hypothetical protein